MSVDFEPVRLGRRGRRIDPIAGGLVVVLVAITVAVLKPWGDANAPVAAGPTPLAPSLTVPSSSPVVPEITSPADQPPPTWPDVLPAISRRQVWGIRAIVNTSATYAERWFAAGILGGAGAGFVVDSAGAPIVALGVTFPPAETPLAVRIWLRHAGEFEWIDTRSVNEAPSRGAYLFLRRDATQATSTRFWEPGRYRIDVLVGDGIRRIEIDIVGRFGVVPDPAPWVRVAGRDGQASAGIDGLPVGLFIWADGAATPLASTPGSPLDEMGAWLDVDRLATGEAARSFVARTYQPGATRVGVALPASSTIRSAALRRLAPFDGPTTQPVGETTTVSGEILSFASFAPPGGETWRPGVYALTVDWEDGDGEHEETWHVELRPGPLRDEPALLSATRAWAHHAGSSGILLGMPGNWSLHEGFDGSSAIGCGKTGILGRPTVIGFAGREGGDLTPVTSNMLFPFADAGPLPVLTASGAVPGLALVAPILTAEFGGPASYGFRAGTGGDAPGYTVCIGLVQPSG